MYPYGKKEIILVSALFLVLLGACNDDFSTPDNGNFIPLEPIKKPLGVPLDTPFSAFIGPHGGVLQYGEHSKTELRMEIPPGAVEEPTSFSIQRITNTHDELSGRTAFRLGPEGIQFKKPIKVSLFYDPKVDMNPQTRMVAFQRNDGVWCGVSTALDESKQRVSFETTHFSDWVWFDFISIRANKKSAGKGEKVELKLLEQVLGALNATNQIDSVPLAAMDEIGLSKDLSIANWKIVKGPGTLAPKINTNALFGNAIYTAPEAIPQFEDVEIQVEVDSKSGYISDPLAPNGRRKFGKLFLITKIQLIPENYISLKLNGIAQNISQQGVSHIINSSIHIRAENEQQALTVSLQCYGTAEGIYPGGDAPGQSKFMLSGQQGGQRYFLNNFFRHCDNQYMYNGTTSVSEKDGYLEGSFIGQAYSLHSVDCEDQEATTVEFLFKIKRGS